MTAAKTSPAVFRCVCGLRTPLEVAIEHDAARRAVARCMESLGAVGQGMMAYMALHRPAERTLTWEKTARLLDELLGTYDAGVVTRDRITHRLTDDVWTAALAAVRDAAPTLTLPLDGHGYLFAILASMAQKAAQTAEREQAARARGETPVGYSAAHGPFAQTRMQPASSSASAGELTGSGLHAPAPVVPMPASVREALANFGKGRKVIAVAPASDEPRGIPPRSVKPERTVPCMAHVDGRDQLVEIVSRKGNKITARLLEAAPGYENAVTISVKDLR